MRKGLFVIFLFIQLFAIAQEYRFIEYGQRDGLPQPYVYDILQGVKGRLYIATGEGLAVFEGIKFQKFTTKNGLAENYCSALFYDSKQKLWIGHFEGGISFKKTKIKYEFGKISTDGLPHARVISFAEDSKQNIYYATSAGGLFVIKNNQIKKFTEEELPPINEIRIKDDILYLATQEGLLIFNLNNRSRSSKIINNTSGKNITCLEISSQNHLWLGIDGEGVKVFGKKGTDNNIDKNFHTELINTKKTVKDIFLYGNNEVWVSLAGEGLRNIRYNSNYQVEKVNVIDEKNGLKSLFINKIFVDNEENFWFGSTGNGLFQFLSSRFESFNKSNFLPFEDVRTLAVDDSDNIYTCSDKQIFVFNVNGKLNTLFNLIATGIEEEIRCSYLNKTANEFWVGTTKNLYILNVAGNKMVIKNKVPALKDKTINYITKDNKGVYLVCTTEGLFYLNHKLDIIGVFTTNEGAPHNNFLGVLPDRENRYWIFSPTTPLYSLFNNEVDLEKSIDSIATFRFSSATQDKDLNIWFATEGDGVFMYSRDKKFRRYTSEDGLTSDFVYGIIVTGKGDVIATHKNGISIKYAKKKTFKSLNSANGLPYNNVNDNAVFKDRRGNIWMGCTEGVIKYNPNEDKVNVNPPLFTFLSVLADSTELPITDTLISLNYKKYEVIFNFIGVSLTNSKGVKYYYKLEGFEDKYRTTYDQSVTYPSLTDGEYRFVIYAENADGICGGKHYLKIHIHKPFWKKLWFILVVATVIILIFYIFYTVRTRNLIKAKIELEELVKEKTAELVLEKEKIQYANELLNEKNRDITASISYAKRIQNAILPDKSYLNQKLNLFVLYKPRDIVSGDFYWYSETNKFIYLAVVDCTGHGVPGAFMSLLGSTFLDQVLSENNEATPSVLLNAVDKKLQFAFRQREEQNRISDGMDAMIIRLTKETNELIFSGANRPLYLYSKQGLQEFKSTIYSIGGAFTNELKAFNDITVKVEQGDCIYIFSDGYSDQFGGAMNKRYSTKRMKAFMKELSKYEITEQYVRLEKELIEWKGDYEQMDDICVIGVKF